MSKGSATKAAAQQQQQAAPATVAQPTAQPAAAFDLMPGRSDKIVVRPFGELTMMLFGEPKSGKTSFCGKNPGAFFFATEPGQDFIRSPKLFVNQDIMAKMGVSHHWQVFQAFVRQVYKDKQSGDLAKKGITNVVIDIVDNLYGYCLTYVCAQKGIAYPPENDFGKTWKEIRDEWETWLRRLMDLVNVTFITHCGEAKVELTHNGMIKEVTRWQPTFKGNKAAQYLDGIVNCIGHVRKDATGRYTICFKGAPNTAAGDRTGILESMGEVALDWQAINDAYEAKAKELGLEVASRWA